MKRIPPKEITDKKFIEEMVNIRSKDINKAFIMKLFGEFNGVRKYNPFDEITIPVGGYGIGEKKNTKPCLTTLGLWIFNKYFIEENFIDIFGYLQESIGKKGIGKLDTRLSYALLENDITPEQMDRYLMSYQEFMPFVNILAPSLSEEMITCATEAHKYLMKLYKEKYKKDVDNKDAFAMSNLEKEVLDHMKEVLKDDDAMDLIDSGAAGSWGNNFKNLFVSKGATKDPETGEFNNILSNYADGISKEDYAAMSNSLAAGPYSRAKLTALGGYKEKIFLRAFQSVILDEPGSDCGTKRYIEVELTGKNISDYMYSYVITPDGLVEITSKNMNSFIGKTVKMRFSNMCESKTGYCNKCAGNAFYRIGHRNVGMALPGIASTLKQKTMKSFHDSVTTFVEMDPWNAFESMNQKNS